MSRLTTSGDGRTEPVPGRPGRRAGETEPADPLVGVARDVLDRFGARVLDPSTAVQVAGQKKLRSTVYLASTLLVRAGAPDDVWRRLDEVASGLGVRVSVPARRARRTKRLRDCALRVCADAGTRFADVARLEPQPGSAVAPDAWTLLQGYRAGGGDPDYVALDHLLTATRHVSPSPFDASAGVAFGAPVASYGQPGWGGRQPVTWLGAVPARPDVPHRRPVVAVLDSGIGDHDWFPFGSDADGAGVRRNVKYDGVRLGLEEKAGQAVTGRFEDDLEGTLDPYSGHGTFIAGLIRQQAPGADILSVRVMPSEGAVPEHVLLDALQQLALRQEHALDGGADTAADIVDVVSLSLGYYDEQPDDGVAPFLLDPIEALGELGVVVVVAAGNDATTRPMYPAAFAPHSGGPVENLSADRIPVVSVGASNPDGTDALFSNAGTWVTTTQPGAALVSTYPKIDAGGQPAVLFHAAGGWRATIDPDSFASGFAVWSGTSFAAPVLAGKVAASLLAAGDELDVTDRDAMVARGWAALREHVPDAKRPARRKRAARTGAR